MPFIEECLPNLIALGATGGPEFRTAIETTPGGFEARSDLWLLERGRWNLAYDARDAATTALLLAFFCSVACGRWNGFRFHDPQPDAHRCVGEYLGTGDGVETTFQLRKLYTVGAVTYVRPITKPVAGTLRLTLDGVGSEAWTLDTTTGVVTMTDPVPLGVLVHGTWLFDVPVRFDTDWLDIRYLEPGLFAWHNATIVEIQDIT